MSYVLTAYTLDFVRLRAAIGSQDEKIITATRKIVGKQFDADHDGLSIGQAVSALIMGTPRGKIATHQFGYALEAIAEHLGKRLAKDAWSGVGWPAVSDAGLGEVITRGSPVKLPKYPDFPMIGFMEHDEVIALSAKHLATPPVVKDRSLQELIDEYIGWVAQAAKARRGASRGLDLLLFYY